MGHGSAALHVVVAGAHGKVARHLARALVADGHRVTGLVRNPDHLEDVAADGVDAVVLDLERADHDELAGVLAGAGGPDRAADAVVFAAGAGPGSGAARKDTVDRGAAVLLADAAEAAGVRRYLLVSSTGVESVRGGARPDGLDEVFLAYLRAKLAAEDDVRARPGLDVVVVRPGALTDGAPTGRVLLAAHAGRAEVTRADVGAVLARLLSVAPPVPVGGLVLELVGGDVEVADAVAALRG